MRTLIISLFLMSLASFGNVPMEDDVGDFITILSIHKKLCGKLPLKQYWFKFGKYRSACENVKTREINEYVKKFEDVEISKKNIFILELNKDINKFVLHHALFAHGGARHWRSYIGRKDIHYFCSRNNTKLCKGFTLNKVKYHK